MLVVRKEEHPGLFRRLHEHLKPRGCALVVEVDEQIVAARAGAERHNRRCDSRATALSIRSWCGWGNARTATVVRAGPEASK